MKEKKRKEKRSSFLGCDFSHSIIDLLHNTGNISPWMETFINNHISQCEDCNSKYGQTMKEEKKGSC